MNRHSQPLIDPTLLVDRLSPPVASCEAEAGLHHYLIRRWTPESWEAIEDPAARPATHLAMTDGSILGFDKVGPTRSLQALMEKQEADGLITINREDGSEVWHGPTR